MLDRDSTLMQRREFVQTSAAATVASLGPAQVQAQTRAAQPKKPSASGRTLPKRMFGKTGVEVTILNAGTLRVAGFMDRLLRLSFSQGVTRKNRWKLGVSSGVGGCFYQIPVGARQL